MDLKGNFGTLVYDVQKSFNIQPGPKAAHRHVSQRVLPIKSSTLVYDKCLPELWTQWGRSSAPVPPSWRCQGSAFWRSFVPARWAAPGWSASCAASVSAGWGSDRSSAAVAAAAASLAPSPACRQSWILQWRCLLPAGEWFLQQSLNQAPCLPDAPGLGPHHPAGILEPLGVRVTLQHPSSLRGRGTF